MFNSISILNSVSILKKIISLILCLGCTHFILAQDPNAYRAGTVKHRLSLGPVASFYKNHPQHTVNTQGQVGFCASYKAEFVLKGKTNFIIGMDYMNEGLTFQGYYSKPGYTYLFDNTFAYTHDIRFQEIQIPLGLKKSFTIEKDKYYSAYALLGVGGRYLFSSYYVISNDSTGDVVYDGKGNMEFEYQTVTKLLNGKGKRFTKGFNAFIQCGLGGQYNYRETGRAIFIEVVYKYGISRLHYQGYDFSNDLNIKDSHLVFNLGLKF